MSNKQQELKVPAGLVEELGTGEDTLGLVGKRIRIVDPGNGFLDAPMPLRFLFGIPAVNPGAVGTVIHVDAEGHYWADFGDDENAEPFLCQDGEVNIHDIASVDADFAIHEVIDEE